MALPDPKPGLVVRYDYLWAHEAAAGRDQSKTRPTCLIAATDPAVRPRYVVLLPITHTPPAGDTVGIQILSYCNRVHYLRSDLDDWAVRRRRRSTSDKAGAAGMRGTREEKGESTDGNRLSVNEAAAFLGASRRTLDRYRAKGGGPAFEKVDGRVYYRRRHGRCRRLQGCRAPRLREVQEGRRREEAGRRRSA